MRTTNTPSQGIIPRVIEAIKVLDIKTQEYILDRIQKEAGISDTFRIEIADLLDARVNEEGGADALRIEYAENQHVIGALQQGLQGVRGRAAQEDRTDQEAFEERASGEQRHLAARYEQDISAVARSIDTRAEALLRGTNDAAQMRNLYNMLNNEKPENGKN